MTKNKVATRIRAAISILATLAITSCASVSLDDYPNITINDEGKVETIRFIHPQFSHEAIKACIQKNVENNDMPIRHSVGLWALWTIFVLLPDEQDSILGGDVILSDEDGVIQAAGNVELESTINGRNFLMFILTAKSTPERETELLFNNPSIVFESTGAGDNLGAIPLGSHSLSIFEKNYNALELLSNRIGDCLRSSSLL